MFLSNKEKILILLHRVDMERMHTLSGKYKSYMIGENKVRKLQEKVYRLGGNPDSRVTIID